MTLEKSMKNQLEVFIYYSTQMIYSIHSDSQLFFLDLGIFYFYQIHDINILFQVRQIHICHSMLPLDLGFLETIQTCVLYGDRESIMITFFNNASTCLVIYFL